MQLAGVLSSDIRRALRQLRRAPGFVITAVLTLALGIGATTAVFSVVEQMLLSPLPYRDASHIVAVSTFDVGRRHMNPRVTGGDYQDIAADPAFATVAYYDSDELGVQLLDHSSFAQVAQVSPSFPHVFGVVPLAGALFAPGAASHQALVSAAFADAELGGARAAVGKLLRVDSESYQVVGVLPRSFAFPQKTSVWVTGPVIPENLHRDAFNYHAVALVSPSVNLSQAQLQMDALSDRLRTQFPQSHAHLQLRAVPLRDALTGGVRGSLLLWLSGVGVLLLIACANVAHLQLVRVSAQGHAWAVRSALGATRARIVGAVLLESALIAVMGSAAGVLISVPATRLLSRLLAAQLPRTLHGAPDLRVLGFSLLMAFAATVLSAALPCWWASRRDPAAALNHGPRSGTTDRSAARWRRSLLTLEVALSFLLIVSSGLLLRTLEHLREVPLGFAPENRLVVYAHAPASGLQEAQRRANQLAQLTESLRTLPGVLGAAETVGLPAGEYGSNGAYAIPAKGQDMQQGGLPGAIFSLAGPGYFDLLQVPLLRGRAFTATDRFGAMPVAVVSASLAKRAFGESDPLGQRIVCGWDENTMQGMTIVGVVGDVRQDSPADQPSPALYMALAQHPFLAHEVQIVLRTATAPAALIPTARARALAVDASIAVKFTTMDDALAASIEPQQLRGTLLTAFAALALLLAAVGIYGVTSYTVAQQVRQIGIRMALGADRSAVSRQVMRAALRSSVLGVMVGCVLCVAATRALAGFLAGVSVTDPFSYVMAAAVLVAAASLAALMPAKRAAAVEPVVALRTE